MPFRTNPRKFLPWRIVKFADGFRPEEVEWDMTENAYRVMVAGQWFTVPDGAVIKQANRIGYALVWYYFDNGALTIRCFLPGSGA